MKKKVLLVFIVLFLLFTKIDVNSECKSDELQALKLEANNLQLTYELIHDEEASQNGGFEYYYNVFVNGYNEKIKIYYIDAFLDNDTLNKNGKMKLYNDFPMGSTISIEIYGNENSKCNGQYITRKSIFLPYYNLYSERTECTEYKDYNICKPNTNTLNVTEQEFLNEIEKIKVKKTEFEKKIKPVELSKFEKIKEFIKNNLLLIAIIGLFIVLTLLFLMNYIIKKNKNKVKIKLGDEL